MPAVINYPMINGLLPDWARIGVVINGSIGKAPIPTKGFRALSYKDKSNGEVVAHNAQLPAGQTSGQIVPDPMSITMLLPEYQQLRQALAGSLFIAPQDKIGFGAYTTMFNMIIQASGVDGSGFPYTINDFIFGCRMAGSDNSHRHGGGALEVTFPVQPVYLSIGGVMPDDYEDYEALKEAMFILFNAQ
jgi:hypothetical protein